MNLIGFKRAIIIGSGEDVPFAPPEDLENSLVICADGGAILARAWGLKPAVIVGDQDSIDYETKRYWQEHKVPFLRFSVDKDQTDLDLAVEHALHLGVTEITLVGAWGNRIDHSLGNLEILYRLAQKGIVNQLLTKENRLVAFCESFKAVVDVGSIASILPLTQTVKNVYTEGLLYPLKGVTLNKGSTLTISNKVICTDISFRCDEGVLLVILQ